MSSPVLILLAAAAAAPAPSTTRVHSPSVDTRLGYLVGDWTIQGLTSRVYRQRCNWYSGRSFVLCTFEDRRDGTVGQAVFGYSKFQQRFTYARFDSTGRSIYQLGFPSGRYGIVFTDERPEPEGVTRLQVTFNLEDDGLRYTQYKSVAGGFWQRTADFLYVPATQRRPVRRRRR